VTFWRSSEEHELSHRSATFQPLFLMVVAACLLTNYLHVRSKNNRSLLPNRYTRENIAGLGIATFNTTS
jgi:hypothetical protein